MTRSLQDIHDERMKKLGDYGLLELEHEYWKARAEESVRTQMKTTDHSVMDTIKGQIWICYEAADDAERALMSQIAKANGEYDGGNHAEGLIGGL